MSPSRAAGERFATEVVKALRERVPGLTAFRPTYGAIGAPDVVLTGVPLLERLHIATHSADQPEPLRRLGVAELDAGERRVGVVIWRKTKSWSFSVTLRWNALCALTGIDGDKATAAPITLALDDFLAAVAPSPPLQIERTA